MSELNDLMPNTPDLNRERLDQFKRLMPDLFTADGRLDPDELKRLVDPERVADSEKFEFRWFGKADAKRRSFTPTTAALQYDAARSVNPEVADGNMIIEGENLEVLKCLLSAYRGKIKCIYIDPPYNTGNDFVYSDNYTEQRKAYWEQTGVTEEGVKVDTNSDSDGRYHSNWLNMMYPRLLAARQLLREDGVIFISIDDHEVHHLRKLCDEVFGGECFVASFVWKKMDSPSRNDAERAITDFHEHILCYRKDKPKLYRKEKKEILDGYNLTLPDGRKARRRQLRKNGKNARREDRPSMWFPLISPDGTEVHPIAPEGWDGRWVLSKETWDQRTEEGLTEWIKREYGWVPYYIEIAPEEPYVPWSTLLDDVDQNRQAAAEYTDLMGSNIPFDSPKPTNLINRFLKVSTCSDDLILDFFAGSGTTGHAVMDLNKEDNGNRKFILVQIPELTDEKSEACKAGYKKISDITIERNKRVIARIAQEQAEKQQQGLFEQGQEPYQPGFKVYRLVKSHFPRVEFQPDPEKTSEENIALLRQYIADKEATLYSLFNEADIFDEVMLKNGFQLHYTREPVTEFTANSVYRVTDGHKTALVCLDAELNDDTVATLSGRDDIFICLERAVDTTKKWNLKHQLGEKLVAF